MFDHPYLETCCRSALHRLTLSGETGRPAGLKDGPCLIRLTDLGLASQRSDSRFETTAKGLLRHDELVTPVPMAAVPANAGRGGAAI